MKLRVEFSEDADEEIIIKCKSINEDIKLLQDLISNIIEKDAELLLFCNNTEYYVPRNDILFFETTDGHTTAHTNDRLFYTNYKLYELEKILPNFFIRVSKSCVLNCCKVATINKNLAGASEVQFKNSYKKVYVSRMYFKIFKQKIDETRLLK